MFIVSTAEVLSSIQSSEVFFNFSTQVLMVAFLVGVSGLAAV